MSTRLQLAKAPRSNRILVNCFVHMCELEGGLVNVIRNIRLSDVVCFLRYCMRYGYHLEWDLLGAILDILQFDHWITYEKAKEIARIVSPVVSAIRYNQSISEIDMETARFYIEIKQICDNITTD